MGRHELHRVQHSHDGGHVSCIVVHAFDPSLRFVQQDILSWYSVKLARRLDASMAKGCGLLEGLEDYTDVAIQVGLPIQSWSW